MQRDEIISYKIICKTYKSRAQKVTLNSVKHRKWRYWSWKM